MNKLQRNLAAVALGTAVTASIFEIAQAALLRAQAARLQKPQALLAAQIEQTTRDRDEAATRLATLRDENAKLDRDTPEVLRLRAASAALSKARRREARDPDTSGVATWFGKAGLLKQRSAEAVRQTPELQLLNEDDFLKQARDHQLDSEEDFRRAMGDLRTTAKWRFGDALPGAFKQFSEANNGQLPTNIQDLAPYLQPPFDSMLGGYDLARPDWVVSYRGSHPTWAVFGKGVFAQDGTRMSASEADANLADPQYDSFVGITSLGKYGLGHGSGASSRAGSSSP